MVTYGSDLPARRRLYIPALTGPDVERYMPSAAAIIAMPNRRMATETDRNLFEAELFTYFVHF